MKVKYKPKGVCSRLMEVETENGKITKVEVTGGCSGNLQGISKLVVGMDVQEAISKLSRALGEFIIEGAHTTVPLGQSLLGDARFARGEYNTSFLDSFMKDVFLITPS